MQFSLSKYFKSTGKQMKKLFHLLSFGILSLFFITSTSAVELKTEEQKLSYALGVYFAQSINKQNFDIDNEQFLQAIEDILNNADLQMSQAEIQEALSKYQQKVAAERNNIAASNKAAGEKFLADNSKKDGVVTTDSGLQYKVIKEGDGEKPGVDSNIKVHYHGTHINGDVFDSSYERGEPISLSLNQVIKGWQEAVPMMKVGSKWKIFVPAELAYGERGAGASIQPNETLLFDIELLGIN
jgi:FKBP-type peptidyl-prolyl cis-trans isomerase FklB